MKNKLLRLLILICCLYALPVYAAGVASSVKGHMEMGGSIDHDGYHSRYFTIKIKGDDGSLGTEEYPAYCINPGAGVAGDVTCDLLTCDDYPMVYTAAATYKSKNDPVADVVFRTLGIMEYASNLFTRYGTAGRMNDNRNNVYLTATWHQAVLDATHIDYPIADVNKPYILTSYVGALTPYIQYWEGRPDGVPATKPSCAGAGGGGATTTGLSGSTFQLTKGGTEKQPEFTVKSSKNASNVSIRGINGTSVVVTEPWSNTTKQAKFKLLSCKTPTVAISGVVTGDPSADTTPYLCTGKGSQQAYVAFLGGVVTEKFNLPVTCDTTCPEQTNYIPEKKSVPGDKSRIEAEDLSTVPESLCCDSGDIEVAEEELNKLFVDQTNTYYNLKYFSNRCNNEVYKDIEGSDSLMKDMASYVMSKAQEPKGDITEDEVFKFCNIYCREDLTVHLPGPISSANGKYFKLNGTPSVDAHRNCRIKIDYRSLRAEYERYVTGASSDPKYSASTTGNEVTTYNNYQSERSNWEMLNTHGNPYVNPGVTVSGISYGSQQMKMTRDECTKSSGTKTASAGSTYSYHESNSNGKCGAAVTETCNAPIGSSCSYTDYSEEPVDHWFPLEGSWTAVVTRWNLKGDPNKEVNCDNTNNGNCRINYYKLKAKDNFKWNGGFQGLELERNGSGERHYYQHVVQIDSYDIQKAVDYTYNNHKSEGYGDYGYSFSESYPASRSAILGTYGYTNNCGSGAPNNGDKCQPDVEADALQAQSDARDAFNIAKKNAQKYENIMYGCELYNDNIATESTPLTLNLNANFHYMQVFLNSFKDKVGPQFIIPIGSQSCDAPAQKDTTYPSSELGSNEGYETKGFNDVHKGLLGDEKSDRNTGYNILDKQDVTSWSHRVVSSDIKYEVTGCALPMPDGDATQTLYPGPTVSGYYVDSGEIDTADEINYDASKNTSTGNQVTHKLQYAVYLTTYTGNYQTWWDLSALGLTKRTIDKFTTAFKDNGKTCAEQYSALSQHTAEDLKESAGNKVPFTCHLDIQLGGMRIGDCGTGFYYQQQCSEPYDINELYEFRVVDTKNIFPQGATTKDGTIYARNWRTGAYGEGGFGKTYTKIQKTATTDGTYNRSNLTYSFKLNTQQMQKMKQYNKSNSYNSFDLQTSCSTGNSGPEDSECGTIQAKGSGACMSGGKWAYSLSKCYSKFLDDLEDDPSHTYGTMTNGTSLASARGKVSWA